MSSFENLVSVQIPAKELAAATQHLSEAFAILEPFMVGLTPEDRRVLPKMADGNTPFVEKTLAYAQTKPEFGPAFLNVKELSIDLKAVSDLSTLARKAQRLYSGLDDTIMLSGSEAYLAALAYYNSVKLAAKMNMPGAQPIYDDLKKRFKGQGITANKSQKAS